jgi:hypothetical protein
MRFQTYIFKPIISGGYFAGINFTLFSDAARTTPIDISGSTITMVMKRGYKSPDSFIFSSEEGHDGSIVITDGGAGKFSLIGTNMNIIPFYYVYDISILMPSGENEKYIKGGWTILEST